MTAESPNSFTIKCYDRNGYDCMFTVRADDTTDFLERITKLTAWLPANGYTPTGRRSGPTTAPQAGNVPVCKYHGEMKPSKFGGYYCPSKMGDGSYCKEKAPDPGQTPMAQAQAVQHAAREAPANGTPPPPLFDDAPPADNYYSSEFN